MCFRKKKKIQKNDSYPKSQQEMDGEIFAMSPVEVWRVSEFKKQHWALHNGKPNSFPIEFERTGIGTIVKVKCKECGTIEDVTCVDNW